MAIEVRNNEAGSRYEIFEGGELVGFAEYALEGDTVVFPHTVIRAARRGGGMGAQLVSRALDDVRSSGKQVVATCWYVAQFIDEHPEYADLLAA